MMSTKELANLAKQNAREEKARARQERIKLHGPNFLDWLRSLFVKESSLIKKSKPAEKKITVDEEGEKLEKKPDKRFRGMDEITRMIVYLKEVFAPTPKPELTPPKYEWPIDNVLLWRAALFTSSIAAILLNWWFLVYRHTKAESFTFELIMLSLVFTLVFYLLIRLVSFIYAPFHYDKNCVFGYWYLGKFYDCNLDSPDAPRFGTMRIGDLIRKKFESFPAGYEFPELAVKPVVGESFVLTLKMPEVIFSVTAEQIIAFERGFGGLLEKAEKRITKAMADAFNTVYKFENGSIIPADPSNPLNLASLKNKLDELLAGCGESTFYFSGYFGEPILSSGKFGTKIPREERLREEQTFDI